MSTIKRIALAAGAVAGAIGVSTGDTSATAEPSFVLPPDYVQLVDDTGTITVAVPNTWTDVSTLPLADSAGNQVPYISAATDYQVYHDTFDAPGVEYYALPFDPNLQGVLDGYTLTGGCNKTETIPYNDGAFVGQHRILTECVGTGLSEWHLVVVAPPDNSRTLVLIIQITGPAEQTALQNILASFNVGTNLATTPTVPGVSTVPVPTVPGVPTVPVPTVPSVPTVPVPTVAGVPTVPVPTVAVVPTVPTPTVPGVTVPGVTVPGATVPGAVPPGFVQLVDDTQAITMVVPATWIDVDTTPLVSDDGTTQTPSIIAATNIADWESSFRAPGAQLVRFPFVADPPALITEIGLPVGSCPVETIEPFTNGVYTGNIGRWASCGTSGQAEYDVIVASPADQSVSYVLLIRSTGPADQAAVATVISSFGPAGPQTVTAPTSPVPTAAVPTVPLPTIPTPATAPGG